MTRGGEERDLDDDDLAVFCAPNTKNSRATLFVEILLSMFLYINGFFSCDRINK